MDEILSLLEKLNLSKIETVVYVNLLKNYKYEENLINDSIKLNTILENRSMFI